MPLASTQDELYTQQFVDSFYETARRVLGPMRTAQYARCAVSRHAVNCSHGLPCTLLALGSCRDSLVCFIGLDDSACMHPGAVTERHTLPRSECHSLTLISSDTWQHVLVSMGPAWVTWTTRSASPACSAHM